MFRTHCVLGRRISAVSSLLIDDLYAQVLSEAFSDWSDDVLSTRIRILHTILCTRQRLSPQSLAELLNVDVETAGLTIASLHAVLYVSGDEKAVYWYHSSFADFIMDEKRSKAHFKEMQLQGMENVYCDTLSVHYHIFERSMSIMKKGLRFNICDLPSSFLKDRDVSDLDLRIAANVSPVLRYCAEHWASHSLLGELQRTPMDKVEGAWIMIEKFLDDQFLFWVELMNLLQLGAPCQLSMLQMYGLAQEVRFRDLITEPN